MEKKKKLYIVGDVRLLRLAEKGDARIGLRGQNINKGVGVTVKGYGSRRLEKFSVNCAENSNIVIGASSRSNDPVVLIYHLHELPYHKRHGLNSFDLLLST